MSSQYLVSDAMIPSTRLKYIGALTPSEVVTLLEETCIQFGNIQVSVIFTGVVSPVTVAILATNDTDVSPQWSTVATYSPTLAVNTYSLNLSYRRVYMTITNGGVANDLALISLYSAAPMPSMKTTDAPIVDSDSFGLSRGIVMARGHVLGSAIKNITAAADASLRVSKGNKLYSFDDAYKLTMQSKFPLDATRQTTRIIAPGTSTLVTGSSLTQTGFDGGAVGAMSVYFGAPIVDDTSIIIVRSSGTFRAGTSTTRITRTSFGHIGLGTHGVDLSFWYNNNGLHSTVLMTINVGNDSVPGIDVTLNGIVYSLVVPPPNPDYRIGCAARIVSAFNALDTPWFARQAGETVIFTSTVFGVAGVTGVTTLDPIFDATMTTIVEGATGTWSHIHAADFNLDKATTWISGGYIEYELSMMNGGRNVKLAIVDNATQDLVDSLTVTLAQKLTTTSDYPISVSAYGAGAVNSLYSASISTIRGTDALPLSTVIFTIPDAYAYTGDIAYPVAIISKIASSHPNAVIRKVIVRTTQPTRVTIALSIQSTINGTYTITSSTTDGNVNMYMNTYNPIVDPINFVFTPGVIVVANNIYSTDEFIVNMPINVTEPVTIGLCSNDLAAFAASVMLIIDYY